MSYHVDISRPIRASRLSEFYDCISVTSAYTDHHLNSSERTACITQPPLNTHVDICVKQRPVNKEYFY